MKSASAPRPFLAVALTFTACAVSACCGPFGGDPPEPDLNLTVVVVTGPQDSSAEQICDADVEAFLLDDNNVVPDDATPIVLAPAEFGDQGCVYRAVVETRSSFLIRATHPDHGEAETIALTDQSDGTCVVVTGIDDIDATIRLPDAA